MKQMKKTISILVISLILLGCGASQKVVQGAVQTAIAQTQAVAPQATDTFLPTSIPQPTNTAQPIETATIVNVIPADARASNYIGGNASPTLPDGDLGKLSVIVVGKYNGNILPVVVRNNTPQDVIRIQVSTTARSTDGSMLAAGGDQGFKPNYVKPGEISLGYIYFDQAMLPDDAKFEFEVTAQDPNNSVYENIRDLDVIEQNLVQNRIIGMLKNSNDVVVSGPITADVYCFDEQGTLLRYDADVTDKDTASPQETIPFQIDMDDNLGPIYLVAAYGYIY
jgi:hypothetical protein